MHLFLISKESQRIMKSCKIKSLQEELILSGLFELEFIRVDLFGLDILLDFNERW